MFYSRLIEIKPTISFSLIPQERTATSRCKITGRSVPKSLVHRSWTHLHGQQQQPPCEPHSWELPESRCCCQGCSVPQCSGSSMTLLLQLRTWSHPTRTLLPGASLKTNFLMNTTLFPLRLQIRLSSSLMNDDPILVTLLNTVCSQQSNFAKIIYGLLT